MPLLRVSAFGSVYTRPAYSAFDLFRSSTGAAAAGCCCPSFFPPCCFWRAVSASSGARRLTIQDGRAGRAQRSAFSAT